MAAGSKHLFLDLENTLITPVTEGWANAALLPLANVKHFIQSFGPDEVHLFSFAIGNKADVRLFNHLVRPRLQDALGVTFNLCPTVDDDILPACCKEKNLSRDFVDFSDLVDFWGKQEAFKLYTTHLFANVPNVSVALLDDVVFDEDYFFIKNKLKGVIRNVDTLYP